MLYYGHDVPAMKESLKKKEQKEKELEETPTEETETKIKHIPHKDSYIVCKAAGLGKYTFLLHSTFLKDFLNKF